MTPRKQLNGKGSVEGERYKPIYCLKNQCKSSCGRLPSQVRRVIIYCFKVVSP